MITHEAIVLPDDMNKKGFNCVVDYLVSKGFEVNEHKELKGTVSKFIDYTNDSIIYKQVING